MAQRGRPPKNKPDEVISQEVTDRPQTLNRSRRPNRVPINGLRDKLSLTGCEPGFHYVIVNDDKVEVYLENDYEFVTHDLKVGDRHINSASSEGGKVSLPVGNGVIGFVMRIPQEWFDDDRAAEQAEIDAKEADMKRHLNSRDDGRYGKVDISQTKPLRN